MGKHSSSAQTLESTNMHCVVISMDPSVLVLIKGQIPFVSALQTLAHWEHNLSMVFGTLRTALLFLTWETSVKICSTLHMTHLDTSAPTNLIQHWGTHTIGQIWGLTLKICTSPHVKNAGTTNLQPKRHPGHHIYYLYQMDKLKVWLWISLAPCL